MLIQEKKPKRPGIFGTIKFTLPVTVGLVAGMAMVPCAFAYYKLPAYHDLIIFIALAGTGAATSVSAYYAAQSLLAGRDDAAEALVREQQHADHATNKERVETAFDYIRRWNDPLFTRTKRQWRIVLAEARAKPADTWKVLDADASKRSIVQDVLNHFEEMALAVRMERADDETLRNYFDHVLIDYYSTFEEWIKKMRIEMHNPTGYAELEALKNRWSQPS